MQNYQFLLDYGLRSPVWQFYGLQTLLYPYNISLTAWQMRVGRHPFTLLSLELISLTVLNKAEQMHIGSDYMASTTIYIDRNGGGGGGQTFNQ